VNYGLIAIFCDIQDPESSWKPKFQNAQKIEEVLWTSDLVSCFIAIFCDIQDPGSSWKPKFQNAHTGPHPSFVPTNFIDSVGAVSYTFMQ
jgi:hypothetical protein